MPRTAKRFKNGPKPSVALALCQLRPNLSKFDHLAELGNSLGRTPGCLAIPE